MPEFESCSSSSKLCGLGLLSLSVSHLMEITVSTSQGCCELVPAKCLELYLVHDKPLAMLVAVDFVIPISNTMITRVASGFRGMFRQWQG